MRFVGRPGGKFMKGAPGNYVHGQVYQVPFRYSKFPFWELLEAVPDVKVPDADETDSVFEEAIYLPEEEYTSSGPSLVTTIEVDEHETPVASNEFLLLDANPEVSPYKEVDDPEFEGWSREDLAQYLSDKEIAYMPSLKTSVLLQMVKRTMSRLDETPEPKVKAVVEEEPVEPNRDELKKLLDEAGVPYKPKVRTVTLRKMVAELVS